MGGVGGEEADAGWYLVPTDSYAALLTETKDAGTTEEYGREGRLSSGVQALPVAPIPPQGLFTEPYICGVCLCFKHCGTCGCCQCTP